MFSALFILRAEKICQFYKNILWFWVDKHRKIEYNN